MTFCMHGDLPLILQVCDMHNIPGYVLPTIEGTRSQDYKYNIQPKLLSRQNRWLHCVVRTSVKTVFHFIDNCV